MADDFLSYEFVDPKRDVRQTIKLSRDWKFFMGDPASAAAVQFDDTDWDVVSVPHDWAIGKAFDKDIDLLPNRQEEIDGQVIHYERSGATGALPHPGVAWYRRRLHVPAKLNDRRFLLRFDGVMSHSRVYVNGHLAGYRPYGYSSFEYDVTDMVEPGKDNVIAVRVDNPPQNSRWYPGAGIYRPVYFNVVQPVYVETWGTYITTPSVTSDQAEVSIAVDVCNSTDRDHSVSLSVELFEPIQTNEADENPDQAGTPRPIKSIQTAETIPARSTRTLQLKTTLSRPVLWDLDNPELYTATCILSAETDSNVMDVHHTRFGIRHIEFDLKRGFLLNGERVKLQGVCMHHDLGALGAAVNVRAIERQLELLQSMGTNAIRTSHNPPAVELLDLCDEMGFLVIDEAFDEWRYNKADNSYAWYFDEWAEKDLADMIKRDRNHPSVIMWSIGNEIAEQHMEEGAETTRFLANLCRRLDPTRPVTAGFNDAPQSVENRLVHELDIVGWNYEHFRYGKWFDELPDMIMFGAETESCVSTRGAYALPVFDGRDVTRSSMESSAYDTESTGWGCPPDYELAAQEQYPQLLGQFTWTGFDYLGEPTPYGRLWPARSSYFGIFDLAGFPKDRYYLYRSVWSKEPTLHLLPHWNWEGHEGRSIPVHCFTSYDSAELFLNGKSLGVRHKQFSQDASDKLNTHEIHSGNAAHVDHSDHRLGWPFTRFRLMWDVPYEPGTLKVVAYDGEGRPAAEVERVTTGVPAQIDLSPDRSVIQADGEDLSFVTVAIKDAAGNVWPKADHRITFYLDGPGEIVALDNGDPTSLEPFHATNRRAFYGLCLAIVRARPGETGLMTLRAESDGLKSATATIEANK